MKRTDLTSGPVAPGLLRFAFPLLLGTLVQQLYNTVDLIFVSHVIDSSASAAIGASTLLIICEIFKHSPVFRVGGDEFAVITQGNDYACIEERIAEVSAHNREALRSGGVVIACGMARYDNDTCVAEVFERADHNMYENKNRLKSGNKVVRPEITCCVRPRCPAAQLRPGAYLSRWQRRIRRFPA